MSPPRADFLPDWQSRVSRATSPMGPRLRARTSCPTGPRHRMTARPEPESAQLGAAELPIQHRRTRAAVRRRARRPASATGPRRGRPRHPEAPNPPRCQLRRPAACTQTGKGGSERTSQSPSPRRRKAARCRPSRGPAAAWVSGLEEVPARATLPHPGSSPGGARSRGGRRWQPRTRRELSLRTIERRRARQSTARVTGVRCRPRSRRGGRRRSLRGP
jgi:hypothetical protein